MSNGFVYLEVFWSVIPLLVATAFGSSCLQNFGEGSGC